MDLNELLSRPDTSYASEDELASALAHPVCTLRTWRCRRKGPPAVAVGRTIRYRIGALRAWLLAKESDFDAARQGVRRRRRVA